MSFELKPDAACW